MFGSQRPHVLDDPVKKERRSWNRVPVQVGVFYLFRGQDRDGGRPIEGLLKRAGEINLAGSLLLLGTRRRFHPSTGRRLRKFDYGHTPTKPCRKRLSTKIHTKI